ERLEDLHPRLYRGEQPARPELLQLPQIGAIGVRSGLRAGPWLRAHPGHPGDVRGAAADGSALQARRPGQRRGSGSGEAARSDREGSEGKRSRREEKVAFTFPLFSQRNAATTADGAPCPGGRKRNRTAVRGFAVGAGGLPETSLKGYPPAIASP